MMGSERGWGLTEDLNS